MFFLQLLASHMNNNITLLHLQRYNPLSRDHFGCCRDTFHSAETISAAAEIQFTQPKPFPLLQKYNSPSRDHFSCCRDTIHPAETISARAEEQFARPKTILAAAEVKTTQPKLRLHLQNYSWLNRISVYIRRIAIYRNKTTFTITECTSSKLNSFLCW